MAAANSMSLTQSGISIIWRAPQAKLKGSVIHQGGLWNERIPTYYHNVYLSQGDKPQSYWEK